MNAQEQRITEILAGFNETVTDNMWRVQGTPVIKHACLERIAAKAKIAFDLPQVIRSERDEAVILVAGRLPDGRMEWSIGEALIGVNYRISGRQAAYVFAMSEKRAKDRVILKLIELHGLAYSEEEADEFRQRDEAPQRQEPPARPLERSPAGRGSSDATDEMSEMTFRERIASAKQINTITDFMLDTATTAFLQSLDGPDRDELRAVAKDRLVALGWPAKRKATREPAHD